MHLTLKSNTGMICRTVQLANRIDPLQSSRVLKLLSLSHYQKLGNTLVDIWTGLCREIHFLT